MLRKRLIHSFVGVSIFVASTTAFAISIDFETLPDLSDVGSFYQAAYGLDFQGAISLTAGISLNEIDFPPHSGSVAVGDNVLNDGDPMILTFANPVDSVLASFAYSSQLTFSAYDSGGALLGTYLTATSSYLGSTEQISLPFVAIGRLDISGAVANSFTMDDLSFEPQAPAAVPDGGATFSLLGTACLLLCAFFRRVKP